VPNGNRHSLHLTSIAAATSSLLALAKLSGRTARTPRCCLAPRAVATPKRATVTLRRSVRVDASSTASFFRGPPADEGSTLLAVDQGAPASGSGAWAEVAFLLQDPLQLNLEILASAEADLPGVPVASAWAALTGQDAAGLEEAWLQLQLSSCYGIPAPLRLLRVRGRAEVGFEVVGEIGTFDSVFRRLRWRVREADFDGSRGTLVLTVQVEGEARQVQHSIGLEARSPSVCHVRSDVRYAPDPPFQTLLNAAGGRQAVEDGNADMLQRIGVLTAGHMDFTADAFYNTVGRAIDLLAPFEDGARAALAAHAGLTQEGAELRVLELGCGTGRWARTFLGTGSGVSRYVGLDSSETMAITAAGALADLDRAVVVRADAREPGAMSQAAETFLGGQPDRILASYVLDLLDEGDTEALLGECRELLRASGGQLGACCICPGGPVMSAWAEAWRAAPGLVGGCRPTELAARLRAAGWEVETEERTAVLGYTSQIVVARPGPGTA